MIKSDEWMARLLSCKNLTAVRLMMAVAALSGQCEMSGEARHLALASMLNVSPEELDKAIEELKRVGLADLVTWN